MRKRESTNAMNVGLNIGSLLAAVHAPVTTIAQQRQIVVDHHVYLENINTPGDDVRSDEDLEDGLMGTKIKEVQGAFIPFRARRESYQ